MTKKKYTTKKKKVQNIKLFYFIKYITIPIQRTIVIKLLIRPTIPEIDFFRFKLIGDIIKPRIDKPKPNKV